MKPLIIWYVGQLESDTNKQTVAKMVHGLSAFDHIVVTGTHEKGVRHEVVYPDHRETISGAAIDYAIKNHHGLITHDRTTGKVRETIQPERPRMTRY